MSTDHDKLLQMFHLIHGEYDNNFSVEILDDYDGSVFVVVTKSGKGECGRYSREDIVFDMMCRFLPPENIGIK